MPALPLPLEKGTYILLFELRHPLEIETRRWGQTMLPPGHLAYVGSAFGPGGLRARLERHSRAEKRQHWHIDALTTRISPNDWVIDTSGERLECVWAQKLAALPQAMIPIPGFGSSDCRTGCPAHLIAFPPDTSPDLSVIRETQESGG